MKWLRGKSDGECASPAGLACCSDVSAVRTGDRQGKAQPQSEPRLRTTAVTPVQPVKNEGQVLLGNADPRVVNDNLYRVVFIPQGYRYGSPGGCVLDGIVQKIHDDSLKAVDVATDKDPIGKLRDETDAFFFGDRSKKVKGLA